MGNVVNLFPTFVSKVIHAIKTNNLKAQEELYKEYGGEDCDEYLDHEFSEEEWHPLSIGFEYAAELLLDNKKVTKKRAEDLAKGVVYTANELAMLRIILKDTLGEDGNFWAHFVGEIKDEKGSVFLVVRRRGDSIDGVEEEFVGWFMNKKNIPSPYQNW